MDLVAGKINVLRVAESNFITAERKFYSENAPYSDAENDYKKAAARGHAAAQYMYGYMLSRGIGEKVNVRRGMRLIKSSARKAYAPAIIATALGYYYGFGFKRSLRRAAKYWAKGNAMGIKEATYYLALAYMKGEGVKKDEKRANELFAVVNLHGFNF